MMTMMMMTMMMMMMMMMIFSVLMISMMSRMMSIMMLTMVLIMMMLIFLMACPCSSYLGNVCVCVYACLCVCVQPAWSDPSLSPVLGQVQPNSTVLNVVGTNCRDGKTKEVQSFVDNEFVFNIQYHIV